eukprot:8413786-Alexandrium_andersonii.AAC.1
MSASLVGSEMCIRDRRCLVSPGLRSSVPQPPQGPLPRPGLCWVGGSAVPVSYTHLTLPTICSV